MSGADREVCVGVCKRNLHWGCGLGGLYAPATGETGIPGQLLGRPSVWAAGIHLVHMHIYILLMDLHPGQPESRTR